MKLLDHPDEYRNGVRVLFLKGRYKDGIVHQRTRQVISHDADAFDDGLKELQLLAQPGERIYASAGPRCLERATRIFKEKQLAADYEEGIQFYRKLTDRWISCLMKPTSEDKENKKWLIDCDTTEDTWAVEDYIAKKDWEHYRYQSKSGTHFILEPFNLKDWPFPEMVHRNAIMLWGY